MTTPITQPALTGASLLPGTAESSVLKALAYFDLFHYPLRREEIRQYLDQPIDDRVLGETLERLVSGEVIFFFHHFYSLQPNPLLVHRRKQGNQRAEKLLPTAMRIGRFLCRFPFVRGIGISGSLSKNYADEKADIDFFIITAANRLWIARTLMHLFKKLSFLAGREHLFCMNYYIDEKALRIGEENIFTAVEVKTVLPVQGRQTMQDFFVANAWCKNFLPACHVPALPPAKRDSRGMKRLIEWALGTKMGDRLDDYLLQKTTRRWQQKVERGERNEKGLRMGLITGKHFARSNPGDFQEKILARYRQKLHELGIV